MKKEWTFYMTKKSVCAIERARETSLRASIKRRWKKVLQSVASRFFFFFLSLFATLRHLKHCVVAAGRK